MNNAERIGYGILGILAGALLGWIIWGFTPVNATVEKPKLPQVEPELPYVEADVECGLVTLDFYNPTNFYFDFDYRVDGEAGHEDEVTGSNISGGTFNGEPFGLRYNEVPVDGRDGNHHEQVVLNFGEDTGTREVNYRLWRGAENDWYIPWLEEDLTVETNCEEEPTPTPTETPEPTPTPEEPERTISEAGAPQCEQVSPTLLPANPLVWRRGGDAIVQWQPTEGSHANIYYYENQDPDNAHAIRETENDGYVEIGMLGGLDWTFGIQQTNGCAGGETVWIIDGATDGWTLFTP